MSFKVKKIFGIGLSRTGTKSLANAFRLLGYKYLHYPKSRQELFSLNGILGACDIPVVRFYKELDKHFPESKFIYTIRDKESWLISCENHFVHKKKNQTAKGWKSDNRIAVYGAIDYTPEQWLKRYNEYDKEIKEYFKDRPNDLLIMDICAGDGWEKLLPFINLDVKYPTFPFPDTKLAVQLK